jgi:hypothetical protein
MEYVNHAMKNLQPWLYTIQHRAREAHVRIDALEKRLADPVDGGAALARAETTVKSLLTRIEVLERKPSIEYHGIYKAGTVYQKGAAVTWGGSLWINQGTTRRQRRASRPLRHVRGG